MSKYYEGPQPNRGYSLPPHTLPLNPFNVKQAQANQFGGLGNPCEQKDVTNVQAAINGLHETIDLSSKLVSELYEKLQWVYRPTDPEPVPATANKHEEVCGLASTINLSKGRLEQINDSLSKLIRIIEL